jgi:MscS family membrane protein
MSPSPVLVSLAQPAGLVDRLRGSMTLGALEVAIWVVASVAVGLALSWVTRRGLRRIARTAKAWDEQFVVRLRGPLAVGFALAAAHVGLSALDIAPSAEATARRVLQGGFVAALFWVLLRSIDVADHLISSSTWATKRLASRSFIGLAAKALKIGVVIIQVVALLSLAGYPVGSLIAGLGIGGLALALGAQKTLEHVFGAFSLAVDQPFREGDFVKIDDVQGTVESVGLRSTRIRTPDRTLVAIPNGKLAEMRTETYAARDRLRFACTLGLTYGTTREQMGRVLAGLEETLRAQPKLWREGVTVRFSAIGASSLDVAVEAWFDTRDWGEFQGIRQEVLLGFMQVVEAAGAALAYPTRTVHVAGASAPPPAGGR